jgi:hypothetical protein
VKVRSDAEIECYNHQMFKAEKRQNDHYDGFDLIDMIKESIEKLMQI